MDYGHLLYSSDIHIHCIDFNSTFRTIWKLFLPNPGGLITTYEGQSEIYDPLIEIFLSHLITDASRTFNTSAFVQNITTATTNSIGNAISLGQNDTIQNCVVKHLTSSVNNTAYSTMVSHLETVRESVTSFRNFEQFQRNYVRNKNFKFPRECIDRLVRISFCGRCKNEIPPLCRNTCGVLIRGCYSPYYDALPGQFNILQNVSCQLLDLMNSTLRGLFAEGQRFFNESLVVSY